MKLSINYELVEKAGRFRLGVIELKNVHVMPSTEIFNKQYSIQVNEIKNKIKLDQINLIPTIQSTRNFYKNLGNDPNRYRPAADSLIRRIVKGLGVYSINNYIDILNYISIVSGFSIGAFDIAKIELPIHMGIGYANEHYIGIGRGSLNIADLPVLRDKQGAFGTPTSDSERTMITDNCKEMIFLFYDFGRHSFLESTLYDTTELIKTFCDQSDFFITIIESN